MIGYVTLGTKDLQRAAAFYDELGKVLGVGRILEYERGIAWGKKEGVGLAINIPFDGKPATVGNGVMVAIACGSRADVDALYAKAIELGGTDEGPPGDRGHGFYAAYFRDLDGNKLNGYFFGQ